MSARGRRVLVVVGAMPVVVVGAMPGSVIMLQGVAGTRTSGRRSVAEEVPHGLMIAVVGAGRSCSGPMIRASQEIGMGTRAGARRR